MQKFLEKACIAYYEKGKPMLSDSEYDLLCEKFNFDRLGYNISGKNVKHLFKLYSLENFFVGEDAFPYTGVITPKLDGAAICLLYQNGYLVQAATRGDGLQGKDITDKMEFVSNIPKRIFTDLTTQIVGEVVANKDIKNSRNYVSGALGLKDLEKFKERNLEFIAYGVQSLGKEIEGDYKSDMGKLKEYGFITVLSKRYCDNFPQDGEVCRLNSNKEYYAAGFTDKYPKGAYAIKKRSKVEVKEAELTQIIWQVGGGGKVTPVAIFSPVVINDATIQRATLHNAGFIEDLDLHYGDKLLVTRAGSVIPKIIGKV